MGARQRPAHAFGARTTGTRTSSASRAMHAILHPRRSCSAVRRAARRTPGTASSRSRTRSPARGCGRSSRRRAGSADRNAVMRREGPGRPHADVEEVALADTRALRVEWYLTYENDADDAGGDRRAPRTASRSGAGCARSSSATTRRAGRLHHCWPRPRASDAAEIDQLYVTPDGALARARRAARRGRAGRGRARRGVGRSPTTKARRARSTSASASRPSGASTRSSGSPSGRGRCPRGSAPSGRTRSRRRARTRWWAGCARRSPGRWRSRSAAPTPRRRRSSASRDRRPWGLRESAAGAVGPDDGQAP